MYAAQKMLHLTLRPVILLARTGIEPVRPFTGPGILSPVRLPVSPPGRAEKSIGHDIAQP